MENEPLVREWMSPNPISIRPDTTLVDAHKIMTDNQIRRLPVLKGEKLVGIVTLGDVRGAEPSEATSLSIWELNYLLSRLTIDKVMSRDVISIHPSTPISEAAGVMLENRIAGLPVVEDGRLVGIITESDIFRMVVERWKAREAAGAPA